MRSYNQEQKVKSIKEKLSVAFKALRKKGYFAKQNFMCCQSCGWSAVPEDKGTKAVFYHKQDLDGLRERGQVFLAWAGEPEEIVNTLTEAGLEVVTPKSNSERILVTGIKEQVVLPPSTTVEIAPAITEALAPALEEVKPKVLTEDMLVYLDELRESGITNMFGASPYVAEAFDLEKKDANAVLSYWMKTFAKRHSK